MVHPRFIIPSVISIVALCVGLSSIKFAINNQFEYAILSITLAAILDTIDGRIARLIKGSSKFGAELDSLIDFLNFGVAPALVVYFASLKNFGNLGWFLVLIYSSCCCLRLARFNLETSVQKWRENFFTGVPSPSGAGILLLPLIFSLSDFSKIFLFVDQLSFIGIILASFLMISKIPTYSLKGLKIKKPYLVLMLLTIGTYFSLLINYPFNTLLFTGLLYIAFIPISFVHFKLIKKRTSKNSQNFISEDLI